MPRATHPGPAALRNRNRVTNKTRLKVIKDSIEADSLILDEDEEKAREELRAREVQAKNLEGAGQMKIRKDYVPKSKSLTD